MLTRERCFPKSVRLRKPLEFRETFASGKRYRCRLFSMTVTNNQHGRARLGLAVSKKFAARAVDRNRIKRIVRESFRHNARTLKAVDIVLEITPRARSASKPVLHESLDKLWAKI